MGAVLTRLLEIFYTKKLDIVVIGLENRYVHSVLCVLIVITAGCLILWCLITLHYLPVNELALFVQCTHITDCSCIVIECSYYSGKTTLLSVLAHGEPVETVPTIGLNVKVFKKGKVNMKCWDIGKLIQQL